MGLSLEDFGRSGISYGLTLTLYDLLYVPLNKGWGFEPLSPMVAGLTVLGCAVCITGIVEWRRVSSQERQKP